MTSNTRPINSELPSGHTNTRGRVYRCLRCDSRPPYERDRSKVITHIYRKHTAFDKVPFYCSICKFVTASKQELERHVQPNVYAAHRAIVDSMKESGQEVREEESLLQNVIHYMPTDKDMVRLTNEDSSNIYQQRQHIAPAPATTISTTQDTDNTNQTSSYSSTTDTATEIRELKEAVKTMGDTMRQLITEIGELTKEVKTLKERNENTENRQAQSDHREHRELGQDRSRESRQNRPYRRPYDGRDRYTHRDKWSVLEYDKVATSLKTLWATHRSFVDLAERGSTLGNSKSKNISEHFDSKSENHSRSKDSHNSYTEHSSGSKSITEQLESKIENQGRSKETHKGSREHSNSKSSIEHDIKSKSHGSKESQKISREHSSNSKSISKDSYAKGENQSRSSSKESNKSSRDHSKYNSISESKSENHDSKGSDKSSTEHSSKSKNISDLHENESKEEFHRSKELHKGSKEHSSESKNISKHPVSKSENHGSKHSHKTSHKSSESEKTKHRSKGSEKETSNPHKSSSSHGSQSRSYSCKSSSNKNSDKSKQISETDKHNKSDGHNLSQSSKRSNTKHSDTDLSVDNLDTMSFEQDTVKISEAVEDKKADEKCEQLKAKFKIKKVSESNTPGLGGKVQGTKRNTLGDDPNEPSPKKMAGVAGDLVSYLPATQAQYRPWRFSDAAQKPDMRKTQMACVGNVVKPPREVRRQQARFGTTNTMDTGLAKSIKLKFQLKSAKMKACKDGCATCSILSQTSIKDTEGNIPYPTATSVTCHQRNLVYAISCRKCDSVVYVGETERTIKKRMKEHLRDIRRGNDRPINKYHFDYNHSHDMATFTVLEKLCPAAGRSERINKESIWIQRLMTFRPYGCNRLDHISDN